MPWPSRTAAPSSSVGRRAVALLVAAVLLSGCGSAGQPVAYPEQGVDGLEVPTPTVRAADFAAEVDNPLLAWLPGQVRSYEIAVGGLPVAESVVEVAGTEDRDGVEVTWVRTRVTSPRRWAYEDGSFVRRGVREWRDAYAQDLAGNVWWVAHDGPADGWRADEGTARAGLVMPATPRVGDAYDHRGVDGLPSAWGRVEDVHAPGRALEEERDDLLVTSGVGFPSPGLVATDEAEARRWYAPGLGLVLELRGDLSVELVGGPA